RQNPEYNPAGAAGQSRSPQPERNAGTSAAEPRHFPENAQFPVAGQSAALPRQPVESDTRQLPVLRISRDGQEATGEGQNIRRTKSTGSGLWTSFASLAVLILLMLGGAKLWRRHGPRMGSVIPGEAVEVLGRRPVDARHSIVLVRLGSRILVLSAGTGGLQTLTELSDPVEVDFLAGQCRQQAAEGAVAQTFRSLFQLESLRGREQTTARASDRTAGRTTAAVTRSAHSPDNAPPAHTEDHSYSAGSQYAASTYYSEENQYSTQPEPGDYSRETDSAGHQAYQYTENQHTDYSAEAYTGSANPVATGTDRSTAETEAFAALNENEEAANRPAHAEPQSGSTREFDRSPSRDSEAILQRLRMHSLSGGTPRPSSSSAAPASAAASDEDTDSSGRPYHEAG
ncbi:MAG: flagellar biosynthetic protein FliO, partial [Planctomycetaceae bacterium]|nr:flagellar biosynthetic protein FliO [Planctomycetaceae bacterium]